MRSLCTNKGGGDGWRDGDLRTETEEARRAERRDGGGRDRPTAQGAEKPPTAGRTHAAAGAQESAPGRRAGASAAASAKSSQSGHGPLPFRAPILRPHSPGAGEARPAFAALAASASCCSQDLPCQAGHLFPCLAGWPLGGPWWRRPEAGMSGPHLRPSPHSAGKGPHLWAGSPV